MICLKVRLLILKKIMIIKKFCRISLFSVCLYVLRCRRSCEKNMAIAKFVQELGIMLFMITINFQV